MRLTRRDPRDSGMECDLRRHRRPGRLESIGAPAWLLGPAVVVALALAFAGWLTLRDVPATVVWLDTGSPGDDSSITGAFPSEENAVESYRWTTSSAIVTVPAPAGARYRLDIAIASTGDAPRTLQITCPGGGATARLGPGTTPPTVAVECRSDGEIPVNITVPETRVIGDGRPLGVAIVDIRVTAINRGIVVIWRLWAGVAIASAVASLWLAASTAAGKRVAATVAVVTIVVAVGVSARRPDWILAIVSGPAAIIALSSGYAARLLADGRRTGPFALGMVSLAAWLLVRPPDPVLLLPALWTPHDAIGRALLPLLAALTVIAAALIGGLRATPLAAVATLIAAGSMLAVVAARPILARWSLVINGPDWTDIASPLGGLLLVTTALVAFLGFRALSTSRLSPRLAVTVVVALVLSILIPWRNVVMDLNGDEPHYYVTAHSLATDGDLELLDDYLTPDYLSATNSPTGNIAVARLASPDRYAGLGPAPAGAWFLVPGRAAGLTADRDAGLVQATNPAPTMVDRDGNQDALPPLLPSSTLVIPISGPCGIASILLASPDGSPATARVRLLDASGTERWRRTVSVDGGTVQQQPGIDPSSCSRDFAGAVVVESNRPLVAEAVDTASGLRVLAARPSATDWMLGPLPRDRYATQSATARLAIHNPGLTSVTATVRLVTSSDTLLRATSVTVEPAATVVLDLDLQDGVAISISAPLPIVATATGWLPGGSYALPAMPSVTAWQLDIPAGADRDAGIWLALANASASPRGVTVDDGFSDTRVIRAFRAEMVHLSGGDVARTVSVAAPDGAIAVAAVAYEERTGALHFDLGLPLLAAIPVRLAGPNGAPIVSALATLLLAAGLFDLLRRIGIADRHAAWSAGTVVLLAPLSPYAVRLYTEPLAGCLVVWSLVCWDRARVRPAFALAALLLAGVLPLVHGRYTPLAFGIAAVTVLTTLRRVDVSRRQVVVGGVVAVALIGVVTVSPLAIALRDRASGGYFSTEWVPRNLLGILFDRGSGLLPFAPWCVLALAAPWRLHPVQRAAIALFVVQLSVVALRAGGWQTFGAPSRYILPVVPLIALLAVPGALRLWRSVGRAFVIAIVAWSAGMTILLHWLPLSGYVYEGRYFIDVARGELPPLSAVDLFPIVTPEVGSNLLGMSLLLVIWAGAWIGIKYDKV